MNKDNASQRKRKQRRFQGKRSSLRTGVLQIMNYYEKCRKRWHCNAILSPEVPLLIEAAKKTRHGRCSLCGNQRLAPAVDVPNTSIFNSHWLAAILCSSESSFHLDVRACGIWQ